MILSESQSSRLQRGSSDSESSAHRRKDVAGARRGLVAPIVWSAIMVIAAIWAYKTGMAQWERSQTADSLLLLAGLLVPIGAIAAIVMTVIRAVVLFLTAIGR